MTIFLGIKIPEWLGIDVPKLDLLDYARELKNYYLKLNINIMEKLKC